MKKARLAAALLVLAILAGQTAFLQGGAVASNAVTVIVDGRRVSFPDAPAYVDENSRTQIPTRYVGEALGAKVEWDKTARRAEFSLGAGGAARSVDFYIGSDVFYIRNSPDSIPVRKKMDTAAVIGNDRTYVPVRFLAESFGATVRWDAATRTVHIASPRPESGKGAGQGAGQITGQDGESMNGQSDGQDGETANVQGAGIRDEAKYDKHGMFLTEYANVFYMQWFESLRITYAGERVFLSYTLPEGLPEDTEFRVTLMCDKIRAGGDWDTRAWLYESFERGPGDREKGCDYLLPNPVSGEVVAEVRYIPYEDIYWIYMNCNMVTPRNSPAMSGSRYAHSSFRVNLNAQDLEKSELRQNALDWWGAEIEEYHKTIAIDGSSIVKFS